ncbi:metallophosphoesterase [Magnetospirillum sp. UT-4]|uniref:metallophosphoesterase family protein n=1 Tax=Magnetospirillum sp. UT-4 TaxID=2681467 RepID=UPI001383A00E|nr:metallophosphoesterase [Magnetospirillum sp. UT-4]CAA7616013.1 Phosphohydrolase [Magnetospirillum sp. UT-4]
MRILAHLSDLHFGRTDERVVEALLEDLSRHRPDVVIVSGDLTQRARTHQFAAARAFLDRLDAPSVVVPGNHDLAPFFNPIHRLFRPRSKFEKHLPGHETWPIWRDDQVVAIGLDSTRHLRWTSGKLRASHLDHVDAVLADASAEAVRVVFLHHPPATALAGHPFEALAERGVDLVLTGHVHKAHVELIVASHHRSCVLVQASTACSTRLREDANGYALISVEPAAMTVETRGWSGERFHATHRHGFHRTGSQWRHAT